MLFDINRAFDIVLNQKNKITTRAVKLFELQVAILECDSSGNANLEGDSFVISSGVRRLRSARVLSSIAILEMTVKAAKSEDHTLARQMLRLFGDAGCREILEYLLISSNGLEKVRYAQRPKDFDEDIVESVARAKSVSNLIDCSLRFQRVPGKSKMTGGVTAALKLVYPDVPYTEENSWNCPRNFETAKNHEREVRPVNVLLWLGHGHTSLLEPPKSAVTSFARKLLSQAENIDGLRAIAASYPSVRDRLLERGYDIPQLTLRRPVEAEPLRFSKLPLEVLRNSFTYAQR